MSLKVSQIQEIVAREMGVSIESMSSPIREPVVTMARHVAMYLAVKLSGKSTPQIAKVFGRKNHTTVISARKKIEKLLESDPDTAALIKRLTVAIRSSTDLEAEITDTIDEIFVNSLVELRDEARRHPLRALRKLLG